MQLTIVAADQRQVVNFPLIAPTFKAQITLHFCDGGHPFVPVAAHQLFCRTSCRKTAHRKAGTKTAQ
jgi:hypothetical protein